MRRIVVVGGGFGGLRALARLEKGLKHRRRVHLALVTERGHFEFTPLMADVAAGHLEPEAVCVPFHDQLDADTELILDRVDALDLERRVLLTQQGEVEFDYAILGPGARSKRAPLTWALSCKSLKQAVDLKHHLVSAIAAADRLSGPARQRHLHVVIAGGGPTGVTLAAELATSLRDRGPEGIDPALSAQLRLTIVERRSSLIGRMPQALREMARQAVDALGVDVVLGREVVAGEPGAVELDDGRVLDADHLIWCTGIEPQPLWEDADVEIVDGRVVVDAQLQLPGHEGIYVIGDAAQPPADVPQTAQVAHQQGPLAASNVIADLAGRSPKPWRYEHRGDIVALGRGGGAALVKGVAMEGMAAYALYRGLYATLMPTAMKRVGLVAQWLGSDLQHLLPR